MFADKIECSFIHIIINIIMKLLPKLSVVTMTQSEGKSKGFFHTYNIVIII